VEKESRALGADLVIPALALAFAVYFFASTAGLAWEAKANGVVIGTALVCLIALQVGRIALRLLRGQGELSLAPLWQPRELFWKRVGLVAVTAAFIGLMPWLGLTLGVFIGLLAQLWLIGVRRRAILFSLPAGVAAALYGLFIVVLDSGFPHGAVENLLAVLQR
jgi:hypothetical protein